LAFEPTREDSHPARLELPTSSQPRCSSPRRTAVRCGAWQAWQRARSRTALLGRLCMRWGPRAGQGKPPGTRPPRRRGARARPHYAAARRRAPSRLPAHSTSLPRWPETQWQVYKFLFKGEQLCGATAGVGTRSSTAAQGLAWARPAAGAAAGGQQPVGIQQQQPRPRSLRRGAAAC
jgi:hypothetical protein